MNNLLIVPIALPLVAAMAAVFLQKWPKLQLAAGLASLLGALAAAAALACQNKHAGIQTLHIGGWEAPFGITLVADMTASLLVLAAVIIAICCLLYAWDPQALDGHHRHYLFPLMLLLTVGVNGSFLTGDIFNLFVFFEVTLIASYVLLTLGGTKVQLRESIKYVLINMIASTVFVVAVAFLYSLLGTLNMAHLSQRVAEAGQSGMLTTVSLLFLVVFATKAALLLFFWLPGPYSAPPAAVSALFAALLTKVGIYAILRMFTLMFSHRPDITHTAMIAMGAATMLLGAFGAVSHSGIRRILAWNVILSVGFILFGIGMADEQSLTGAFVYLIHDMVTKAWIFILGGAVIAIAGTDRFREIKGLIRYRPQLGWMFLLAAMAIAGVPPLSGFTGKVLILKSGVEQGAYITSIIGLVTSLIAFYSLLKVFIGSFWGETLLNEGEQHATGRNAVLPGLILCALSFGLGIGSGFVLEWVEPAVHTLLNPSAYIQSVLGTGNG
jgi:multicomponent Na+:H+ antiporter subunit D